MVRTLVRVAVVAIGFSRVAMADDDTESSLLRRGVELRRQHQNQEALVLFARALATKPTPVARAQVALAEQALGRWLEAEADLKRALEAKDDPWIAKNGEVLAEARAEIERHLGWLSVDVDVPSAVARFDGREIASGGETRVLAGAGVLEVHADGFVPDVRRMEIGANEHAHIAVSLVKLVLKAPPVSADAPRAYEPAPAPAPRSQIVPIALLGVGAVGVSIGAYFGFKTIDWKQQRDAFCNSDHSVCSVEGRDYDNSARASAARSTAAFGIGLAAAAAGGLWWVLDRPAKPGTSVASANAGSVAIGFRGANLCIDGTFP